MPAFRRGRQLTFGARRVLRVLAFHLRGLARKSAYGREVTGTIVHSTGSERYSRLNEAVCVLAGEARRDDIRLEVAELVWEQLDG